MITTYETIKFTRVIKGTCLKCGKTKRQVTIVSEQTINPFNKNKAGKVKTRDEIMAECEVNLQKLTIRWRDKFICKTCFNKLPWGVKWFELTEREYCENYKLQKEE